MAAPAYSSWSPFMLLLAMSMLLHSETAPPPAAECVNELVMFTPCLAFISSPPKNLSGAVPAKCCDAISTASNSGGGFCVGCLLRQPPMLGFPLNESRALSLLPPFAIGGIRLWNRFALGLILKQYLLTQEFLTLLILAWFPGCLLFILKESVFWAPSNQTPPPLMGLPPESNNSTPPPSSPPDSKSSRSRPPSPLTPESNKSTPPLILPPDSKNPGTKSSLLPQLAKKLTRPSSPTVDDALFSFLAAADQLKRISTWFQTSILVSPFLV